MNLDNIAGHGVSTSELKCSFMNSKNFDCAYTLWNDLEKRYPNYSLKSLDEILHMTIAFRKVKLDDPSFDEQFFELRDLIRSKVNVGTIVNIVSSAIRIHSLNECRAHITNENENDNVGDQENGDVGGHDYYDVSHDEHEDYDNMMINLSLMNLMANAHKDYTSGGKEWVLDSGCTDHMISDKDMFCELDKNDGPRTYVTFGDNSKGKVLGLGKVAITRDNSIKNGMLVESLGYNLLSVSKLTDYGFNVLFTKVDCQVFRQDDYSMVFTGVRRGDLDFTISPQPRTCLLAESSKGWLWHRRLGHVGMRNLDKLIKGDHISGVKDVIFDKDRLSSACQAGKQVGGSHPVKNIMTTKRPLELLHMDLFGPNAYKSLGGNSFGLVIVDDFSRFTWVFFLEDKSQVQKIFKTFAKKAQNQFEVKIKKVRSDNGSEFKNTNVDTFLDEEGIAHEFSTTYKPQQNGVVERKNRTLIEMARTMLDEYKTPRHFWVEAMETTYHAINRLYLYKILGKTAYDGYFRVFGSKCYILDKHRRSKFTPKSHEGFFSLVTDQTLTLTVSITTSLEKLKRR